MPETELPEIVELTIPLQRDRLTQLAAACELLGTPMEKYLTEAIDAAFSAHMQRAEGVRQRLEAARRESENLNVRVINPATRERIEMPRERQPVSPALPGPRV